MTKRQYGVILTAPKRLLGSINTAGQPPKYERIKSDDNAPDDYYARAEFWKALERWAMFEWGEIQDENDGVKGPTFAIDQKHKAANDIRRYAIDGYDVVIDPRDEGEPHEHYRRLARGLFAEAAMNRKKDPRLPRHFNAGYEYILELDRRGLEIEPPVEGE